MDAMKWIFYLDPVGQDSGALRVIPGSHLLDGDERVAFAEAVAAMPAEDVPCSVCATEPGDVVAFNIRTWHCSIGGGDNRSGLNMDIFRLPETAQEKDALCQLGKGHASSNRGEPESRPPRQR
jgi:ectoine hydroxylase-related dioxygenase (phytanoyl-CoA dioxygenase family)